MNRFQNDGSSFVVIRNPWHDRPAAVTIQAERIPDGPGFPDNLYSLPPGSLITAHVADLDDQ